MYTTIKFTSFSDYEIWAQKNIELLCESCKSGKINGYRLNNYNEKVEKFKGLEINGFSEIKPFIIVRPQYKGISDDFEFYYVDYLYPILKVGNLFLQPLAQSYTATTFSFCINNLPINKKLSNFKTKLEEPKKVGKATIKKIAEWIEYLENVEAEKESYIESKNIKINTFLERLKPYETLIEWNLDKTKGTITKGGLRYNFNIESSGYISENWERDNQTSSKIETFLAIADNKYKF